MQAPKQLINVILMVVLLGGSQARADFLCAEDGQGVTLIEPKAPATRTYKAEVTLGGEPVTFNALPVAILESHLYSVYEYKLWRGGLQTEPQAKLQPEQQAKLIITSRIKTGRGGCGRRLCDANDPAIQKFLAKEINAKLEIGDETIYLQCVESGAVES